MYKESVEVPHTVLRENVKNLVRDSSFNTNTIDNTFYTIQNFLAEGEGPNIADFLKTIFIRFSKTCCMNMYHVPLPVPLLQLITMFETCTP